MIAEATVEMVYTYAGWIQRQAELIGGTSRHVYIAKEVLEFAGMRNLSFFVVVRAGYCSPESFCHERDAARVLLVQACESSKAAERLALNLINQSQEVPCNSILN